MLTIISKLHQERSLKCFDALTLLCASVCDSSTIYRIRGLFRFAVSFQSKMRTVCSFSPGIAIADRCIIDRLSFLPLSDLLTSGSGHKNRASGAESTLRSSSQVSFLSQLNVDPQISRRVTRSDRPILTPSVLCLRVWLG